MIARIHSILEASNSEVTWNDRIPDPDNPAQTRQVDATIRNDGRLTLVECRLHKARQDVKWIEELIGRRTSLGADAVIAVSASGFTEGASLKADRYGIITRDFASLTAEEVQRWGKVSSVTVNHMQFENPILTLSCYRSSVPFAVDQQALMEVFYEAAHKATLQVFDETAETSRVAIGFHAERLMMGSRQIYYVKLDATLHKIIQVIETTSVLAYGLTNEAPLARDTLVEQFTDIMNIEHIGESNVVVVDLSRIEQPPNSVFHSAEVDMKVGRVPELKIVTLGGFRPSLELAFNVVLDEKDGGT